MNTKNKKHKKFKYPELLTSLERKSKKYFDFFSKVKRTLEVELYVEKKSKIILAVSGGVDSITLLDIFINLKAEMNFELAVIHFNHKLREKESDRDQRFVEKVCKANEIKFFKSSANVEKYASDKSMSIEEAARVKRYQYFEKVCIKYKYEYLATAHTKNDLAETFLLNLFRGSGLHGLTSIPTRRRLTKNSFVVRPLINLTKDELIEYANARDLQWVEDKTNDELIYTRNKIRNLLIPEIEENYNPNFVNTIERTASIIKSANQFVSDYTEANFKKIFITAIQGKVEINSQFLDSYAEIIQNEMVRKTLSRYFSFHHAPYEITERIAELTSKNVNTKVEISNNLIALKERGKILIQKVVEEKVETINQIIEPKGLVKIGGYEIKFSLVERKDVNFVKDNNVEYFDTEFMPNKLLIRNWINGDKLTPFGFDGTIKVSDLLNNKKLSNSSKESLLVLTDKIDIIWVLGIRMSNKYAVKKDSKQILKAEILKNPIN
ncbi:MAG: tRNA lysidine(34) synthetase TilS [Candidatus Kapaibacterium sp.]|nr:tRNA lysidine(34) synthetase TilS [Ignavibacteriota bacterium]MCB9220946.1 tRNA lysidine(34) synthetase TilS [Ignavibacteria bacterium]